jgi:hypothetical protein
MCALAINGVCAFSDLLAANLIDPANGNERI